VTLSSAANCSVVYPTSEDCYEESDLSYNDYI